jgi:hypothetical protein
MLLFLLFHLLFALLSSHPLLPTFSILDLLLLRLSLHPPLLLFLTLAKLLQMRIIVKIGLNQPKRSMNEVVGLHWKVLLSGKALQNVYDKPEQRIDIIRSNVQSTIV